MKKIVAPLVIILAALPALAQKPCEELKSEIAANLSAKGVRHFQLDILAFDKIKNEKVVGSCDGGKNRIIFKKP